MFHPSAHVLLALALLAPIALPQTPPDSTKTNAADGLTYARIPAGSFVMGCSRDECRSNEKPAHQVTLTKDFWIGITEVTTGAYKRFAENTHRTMPSAPAFNPEWKNDRLPISNVTWQDAADYCKWAGGALPSEAQWEYAARGGSTKDPYGPLDQIAWTSSNSGNERIDSEALSRNDPAHYEETLKKNGNRPHEVAQKRPNGYGLYDMIGNMLEFTNDFADLNYYQHSPEQDPAGPATGNMRISRGGHFLYPDRACRASKRLWGSGKEASPIEGFRCILPASK